MTDEQLKLADDLPTILDGWAKAYRDSPEHRFPSDPHAEFFPLDLENAAKALRAATGPAPTEALLASQHLLETIHRLNTHGSVREYDWEEGGVGDLIANRISENRAALSVGEAVGAPVGDFYLVPREIIDQFPEININNYDHDDACGLNAWGCEVVTSAAPAALPSEAIGREWQPIETAPKIHGQTILVFRPGAKRYPVVGVDYWSDAYTDGCWAKSPRDEQPTRWMPLPAGPSGTRPQSGGAT